jgi:hypothetical protein
MIKAFWVIGIVLLVLWVFTGWYALTQTEAQTKKRFLISEKEGLCQVYFDTETKVEYLVCSKSEFYGPALAVCKMPQR